MPIRRVLVLAVVVVAPACVHAPGTSRVATADPYPDAIDAVLRTLRSHGLEPGTVDRSSGTIVTRWKDTGFRFREAGLPSIGYYSEVFLRHHVSITETDGALKVTLRTEAQRCAPLDAVITNDRVVGSCQPMEAVFSTQQAQIQQLAQQLDRAISRPRA